MVQIYAYMCVCVCAELNLTSTKRSSPRMHNTLKEHRIQGSSKRLYPRPRVKATICTCVRAETHSSTDWTFPLLTGLQRQQLEDPSVVKHSPDCTETTGYWNGSIKCSWNKSYSQPVSNPLPSFSFTPSSLCIHSPPLTFSLISLPLVTVSPSC